MANRELMLGDFAGTEEAPYRIEFVDGSVTADGLTHLSADAILPLWEASDGKMPVGQIGCCSGDPGVVRVNCDETSKFTCRPGD